MECGLSQALSPGSPPRGPLCGSEAAGDLVGENSTNSSTGVRNHPCTCVAVGLQPEGYWNLGPTVSMHGGKKKNAMGNGRQLIAAETTWQED